MCYEIYWLYIHTYIHTYIQVYNFLNPTQLLSALIYSSKEYLLFENFSWIVFSLFSFCLNTRLVGSTCLKTSPELSLVFSPFARTLVLWVRQPHLPQVVFGGLAAPLTLLQSGVKTVESKIFLEIFSWFMPSSSTPVSSSVATCSVLNSSTILHVWVVLSCQVVDFVMPPLAWLFVRGPSSLYWQMCLSCFVQQSKGCVVNLTWFTRQKEIG